MPVRILLLLLSIQCLASVLVAGQSTPVRSIKEIQGSYSLRVLVDKSEIKPSETITVSIEFTNTSDHDIWIPELDDLGLTLESFSGSESSTEFPTHSTHINNVKLSAGQKHSFRKTLNPTLRARAVRVFIFDRPDISAEFVINHPQPQQPNKAL